MSAAKRYFTMIHQTSQPGVHETNSAAERNNQDILDGLRTVLVQAGLPASFWPYAGRYYCCQRNFRPDADGISPWQRMHGEPFTGKLVPFGAKITFKPNTTKGAEQEKMEPQTVVGIFLGYIVKSIDQN